MDCSDDRLPGPVEADGLDIQVAGLAGFGSSNQHLLDVTTITKLRACAKRRALCRQDEGAALRILIQCFTGVGNLANKLDVKKVMRRPADLDGSHHLLQFDTDILEWAHADTPVLIVVHVAGGNRKLKSDI